MIYDIKLAKSGRLMASLNAGRYSTDWVEVDSYFNDRSLDSIESMLAIPLSRDGGKLTLDSLLYCWNNYLESMAGICKEAEWRSSGMRLMFDTFFHNEADSLIWDAFRVTRCSL